MDLELLVREFQRKNVKAFEKLYELYHESVSGVIYSIVKDSALTEEILQDVFVKAWKNADKYSERKGRFFTWILNIARNASIDVLRSKSFKNESKNINAEYFSEVIETHESLDSTTNTIGLKAIVNKLAEKCKSVIYLIYFRGYTQKEVAEQLEIPLGTVKTRARNCLKELKTLM